MSARQDIHILEPFAVQETFATGAEIEEGDGFVCLTWYRDKQTIYRGEPQLERVIVDRITLPFSAVAQVQRAIASIGHNAPKGGLALIEARGSA